MQQIARLEQQSKELSVAHKGLELSDNEKNQKIKDLEKQQRMWKQEKDELMRVIISESERGVRRRTRTCGCDEKLMDHLWIFCTGADRSPGEIPTAVQRTQGRYWPAETGHDGVHGSVG
jgi:hypothetical protein